MSRSSGARKDRRRAKRERRKGLSSSQTKGDPGKELYASIEGAIEAVTVRHRGSPAKLTPEMVVQALCLVTCNLAIHEEISKSQIQDMMGAYMDQVWGVIRTQRDIEQRKVSPGGLILLG